jgi:hypothetical protein
MTFHVPEKFRLRTGHTGTNESFGNNGAFVVNLAHGQRVFVIASDGGGWEHVSVSRRDRAPTWDEMCQVKALFWDADDCVMQLHPPQADYVNNHSRCLHLWRPVGVDLPRPPDWMVGYRELGVLA